MIISTRGRYALRVMIDLAGQDPNTYTPLKEIAARQEISEKYLEIFSSLLLPVAWSLDFAEKAVAISSLRNRRIILFLQFSVSQRDHLHRWHVLKKMRLNVKGKRFALPAHFGKNWIHWSRIILAVSHWKTWLMGLSDKKERYSRMTAHPWSNVLSFL